MPLTFAQWVKDERRRNALAAVLENPVLKEAFETLESAYFPHVPEGISIGGQAAPPPGADLNNLLALRYVHRTGFYGFRNALANLAKDRELKVTNAEPWQPLLPEGAKAPKAPNQKPRGK